MVRDLMAEGPGFRFSDQTLYRDRIDAGAALAKQLGAYHGPRVLVVGIPRGGVVVAAEVARLLEAELDVVVARKLGAPGRQEFAIGAVTADGGRFLNLDVIAELSVSEPYLEAVTRVQMTEARRREEWLRSLSPAAPIAGRTVILVDDGLATGATMRASARSLRQRQPARLVAAVPVGSRAACAALRPDVDEVVCLRQPEPFVAIRIYYHHFEPVEDEQVRELLRDAAQERAQPAGEP
jgi:putative phosphoribosyl transferase